MIDLTLSSEDEAPPKRRRVVQASLPQPKYYPSSKSNLSPAAAALPGRADPVAATFPPPGPPAGGQGVNPVQDQQLKHLKPPGTVSIDDLFPAGLDDDDDDHRSDDADGTAGGRGHADSQWDRHAAQECDVDGNAGVGGVGRGKGRKLVTGWIKEDTEEDWEPGGGSGSDGEAAPAGARKRRGGARKCLMADEREERDRAKAAEKAAKAAERARSKEEKAAIKAAEKERKAAEKDELKRAKAAQKEAVKEQKEAGNALKATMVGRYMRLLMSNTLAATPLGIKMVDLIPVVRAGKKDETFPHEVHKDMPLAARGYRYCMWGTRLPAASAARLQAVEGCALESSGLPDPTGKDMPLMLFPALLLVLTGEELLLRLEVSNPAAPLESLYKDVARAHPDASLVVYVVGLAEAMRGRERVNKAFSRAAIEDVLFDVVLGMPAVRLQYDCPEGDLTRAATDILNLGYTLSQQPKKRLEAYLDTFGSRTTVPLRAIKEVLAQQGGPEQLTLCEALSQLVAPQRAAAVASEYPSLAAIIEALRARPEGRARDGLLARCRIPGVEAAKGRQHVAGPVAAARLARFLLTQNGRDEWKDTED